MAAKRALSLPVASSPAPKRPRIVAKLPKSGNPKKNREGKKALLSEEMNRSFFGDQEELQKSVCNSEDFVRQHDQQVQESWTLKRKSGPSEDATQGRPKEAKIVNDSTSGRNSTLEETLKDGTIKEKKSSFLPNLAAGSNPSGSNLIWKSVGDSNLTKNRKETLDHEVLCLWCRRKGPWHLSVPVAEVCRQPSLIENYGQDAVSKYRTHRAQLVDASTEKRSVIDIVGVGSVCSLPCARSYARTKAKLDPLFHDSDSLLVTIYSLLKPGERLPFAKDWELLKDNGGPLNDEEFFDHSRQVVSRPLILNFTPMPQSWSVSQKPG